MYLTDYHIHTALSFDGQAPLSEMAEAALAAGLDELCVTDHCDFLDENGAPVRTYDWDAAVEQYRAALPAFQGRLKLRLGLELGMPHLDAGAAAGICARPEADFILGSVHNLCPEKGGTDLFYVDYSTPARCYAALDDYFTSLEALSRTGFYDVLAHIIYPLRYLRLPVSLDRYWGCIRAILRTVVEAGRGLEVNTYRGQTLAEWGPVLDLYRDCGGEIVTVGSDAHAPGDVGKGVREACALLGAHGFRYACTYEKHRPEFHSL